jgi:hypothetical protein
MYLEKQETEFSVLRQGDILEGIQILGALNLGAINIGTNFKGEQVSWSLSNKPNFSHVMVLSHSCEIDPQNDIKITSIILAPLRDLNKATPDEKIEEIISSNFIDDSRNYSYLKYFYLEPNDLLPYPNGAIVDYSKCFSVRKNTYKFLLEHKVLQVNKETLNYMSLKLALYFYREEMVNSQYKIQG